MNCELSCPHLYATTGSESPEREEGEVEMVYVCERERRERV